MIRHGEKGAAAVEFAILLPVLVTVLFGIIEFGFAFYTKEVLTNASREAARSGIVQAAPKPTVPEIQTVVTTYLTGTGVDPATAITTVNGAGGAFPTDLTVTVTYPYAFTVLPNFAGIGSLITLTAQTVMRHE